jgi:hypothetical protein
MIVKADASLLGLMSEHFVERPFWAFQQAHPICRY